jgi:tartrate dehydratase beta subunit/fumarate hydratase class I family protein
VEADSRSKSSARPEAPTTHVSGADFPAFIVIDDKGNDFFKDSNLG